MIAEIKTKRLFVLFPHSLVLMFYILFSSPIKAQINSPEEYQLKAVFLYNFTRFVDWPLHSFSNSNSPFVIGIVGNDPFGSNLEEAIRGESVGSHTMIIQHYSEITESTNCHLLFINSKDPDEIRGILEAVKGKNILTVNEYSKFPQLGGMVQFINENNKIKLVINNNAVKVTQLQISSKLLSVARIY